ncbi:PAS domain-containing protein [Aeoliella sp.]|uniref:PAS domain-containing protein n=1 Tax=Aeoliella sp. TaxID=2795800 RepID=UPI003CCC274A
MPIESDVADSSSRAGYRSSFEQLLTSLSTRFINLPVESIDDGIVEALEKVGSYTDVDRCFVYQYKDAEEKTAQLTHEWCAPGIPSLKERLQNIEVAPLSWITSQLAANQPVHVPDTHGLPNDAAPVKQLFEKLGIRSAFYLPLFFEHGGTGMLGFSCVSHKKAWSSDSMALLEVVGEIVVNSIDRQHTFRELEASREQYRSVVEDQSEFIARWKPDGTQTFVNGALSRFLGLTPEELLKRNVFEFIHPDDAEPLRKKVASLTPDQPAIFDEQRIVQADGTIAWHEWWDRGLFDSDGNLYEVQSVGRDITAQKQAREELDYRQQLESLILNLTSRFINLEPDELGDQIIDALRQVGEFVGGDRSYIYLLHQEAGEVELAYQWLAPDAIEPPPELQRVSTIENAWGMPALEQGLPLMMSSLDEIPPGSEKLRKDIESIGIQSFIVVPTFFENRLFAFLGISSKERGREWSEETAAILRLLGEVFVNALARKAAQEALATSEERLSLTIDAVADGFYDWYIPSDQVYVSDNWLASRRLPLGNNSLDMEDWEKSIHTDDLAEVADRVADHLAGRTGVFQCEYRVVLSDGSVRWMLDRGRVIDRDEAGAPLRMVGIDRDITDEVERRQRLEESDARLAHLARVATMGEVVGGIAHEVNQPLHAAATFANAMTTALENKEPGFVERVAVMGRKISTQINRAADIIRRLRNFTRPQQVHMARFDLNGLVRETAEMLGFVSRRKNIRVEFHLDEFLPKVTGDQVQIQQVIVNLLRNAFDAAGESSASPRRVSVSTSQSGDGVLMEVCDNGTGLTGGVEIESLFDAFTTSKEEGMGIGLAICRSIISSHHGKIWGRANEDVGMTFSVLLPADREADS